MAKSGWNQRAWHPRSGMALAAALVSLLVVMVFAGAIVRALVMQHRSSQWDERQLQCLYLVESAVEKTKACCAADPNYAGETWTVTLADRGADRQGVARIRVEPVANEPLRRRVEIEARWPDDPLLRIQRTKQFTLTLPPSGEAS